MSIYRGVVARYCMAWRDGVLPTIHEPHIHRFRIRTFVITADISTYSRWRRRISRRRGDFRAFRLTTLCRLLLLCRTTYGFDQSGVELPGRKLNQPMRKSMLIWSSSLMNCIFLSNVYRRPTRFSLSRMDPVIYGSEGCESGWMDNIRIQWSIFGFISTST